MIRSLYGLSGGWSAGVTVALIATGHIAPELLPGATIFVACTWIYSLALLGAILIRGECDVLILSWRIATGLDRCMIVAFSFPIFALAKWGRWDAGR